MMCCCSAHTIVALLIAVAAFAEFCREAVGESCIWDRAFHDCQGYVGAQRKTSSAHFKHMRSAIVAFSQTACGLWNQFSNLLCAALYLLYRLFAAMLTMRPWDQVCVAL
jgi:hypothetical protein